MNFKFSSYFWYQEIFCPRGFFVRSPRKTKNHLSDLRMTFWLIFVVLQIPVLEMAYVLEMEIVQQDNVFVWKVSMGLCVSKVCFCLPFRSIKLSLHNTFFQKFVQVTVRAMEIALGEFVHVLPVTPGQLVTCVSFSLFPSFSMYPNWPSF